MTLAAFDIALAYTLHNEGTSYVHDKDDHGLCSRYGVTRSTLSAWRNKPCTCEDVAQLAMAEIREIYKISYWDAMKLDQIGPQATATALFDMGVLNGPKEAVKLMQSCVHVLEDGVLGPKTLAAINSHTASFLVPLFAQMFQLHFLHLVKADSTQAKWLNNWLQRATRLMILAV